MGVVDLSTIDWQGNSLGSSINELGTTFGAAFGPEGMGSLFSDSAKIPQVIMTIIAFSLSDTFDTIGTFIGTGRRTGIFSQKTKKRWKIVKGSIQRWTKPFCRCNCNFDRCDLWNI